MRIVVCGGRDYLDHAELFAVLDRLHAEKRISFLAHGCCRGADLLADQWAKERGIKARGFAANWSYYGAAAGPRRNAKMLDEFAPQLVVAFPGTRGTADCIRKARDRGIEVLEVGCGRA
jgi:hypothetical protein